MNKLKARIVEKGLSISEIAENLNVTEQAVYMMIRGERTIKKEQIEQLASVLDLSESDIESIFLPTKWKTVPPSKKG